jgi:hypothetical protein
VSLRLQQERDAAERKAWDSLSRYKFLMFGYWAAIWVHLNHLIEDRAENPFRDLVKAARIAPRPDPERWGPRTEHGAAHKPSPEATKK